MESDFQVGISRARSLIGRYFHLVLAILLRVARPYLIVSQIGYGIAFLTPAFSADWPQWRGPRADGSVAGASRLKPLPDRPSILWNREIGGGYSGPVSSGDYIWVHSRQSSEELVNCLRLSTGEVVWHESYSAPFRQDDSALAHGCGPYSTPALKGGRLFTFGINSVLIAWDAATGELLWRKNSADEFEPSFPYFGAASSPVVWEDLVFVHLGGHERRRIESPSQGAMAALSVSDGKEKWRWTGDGPAIGATPVITEIEGQQQLVFKTKKMIVGLDALTGKELWRMPYTVSQDNTIVTPFFVNECLITSDFDHGVSAWRIATRGREWAVQPLWKQRQVSMFMSTPVLARGLLVGFSHLRRGQLFLLEPETGEVRWLGDTRSGEHVSLISWSDEIMVFTEDGWLIIGKVEPNNLRELKRYRLGGSTGWSHPAFNNGHIIYRDGSKLAVCLLARVRAGQN